MVRVLSVVVFAGLGVAMILARNAEPYYARPVQSSAGRRLAAGVALIGMALVLALTPLVSAGALG